MERQLVADGGWAFRGNDDASNVAEAEKQVTQPEHIMLLEMHLQTWYYRVNLQKTAVTAWLAGQTIGGQTGNFFEDMCCLSHLKRLAFTLENTAAHVAQAKQIVILLPKLQSLQVAAECDEIQLLYFLQVLVDLPNISALAVYPRYAVSYHLPYSTLSTSDILTWAVVLAVSFFQISCSTFMQDTFQNYSKTTLSHIGHANALRVTIGTFRIGSTVWLTRKPSASALVDAL